MALVYFLSIAFALNYLGHVVKFVHAMPGFYLLELCFHLSCLMATTKTIWRGSFQKRFVSRKLTIVVSTQSMFYLDRRLYGSGVVIWCSVILPNLVG